MFVPVIERAALALAVIGLVACSSGDIGDTGNSGNSGDSAGDSGDSGAGGVGGTGGTGGTGPAAYVEVGTGAVAFEEIGTELEVIRGPQGGYHIIGSMQVFGVHPGDFQDLTDPQNPTTTFSVWLTTPEPDERIDVVEATTYVQGLRPLDGEEGVYKMTGRFVILDICEQDPGFPPCRFESDDDIANAAIRVDVSITGCDPADPNVNGPGVCDTSALTVTDSATSIAVPHPLNP